MIVVSSRRMSLSHDHDLRLTRPGELHALEQVLERMRTGGRTGQRDHVTRRRRDERDARERAELVVAVDVVLRQVGRPQLDRGRRRVRDEHVAVAVEDDAARRLDRDVEDLVVMVLDRPRHEKLIADIRKAGARIRLIGDGDLSAGIAAAVIGTGVHAVMGSGGAPEGVITAAAIRCLNGYMLGRLVLTKPEQQERMAKMGIKDVKRIYKAEDLAPGKQLIFAATGVTDGALMKGVRFFGEGTRTSSVIVTLKTGRVRFIESIHLEKKPDVKVRFA